jgi:iron complex outermembrane receptor protein
VRTAYTYVDARYRDAFTTCTSAPCMAPNQTIPAATAFPAPAPRRFARARLGPPSGWQAALDFRALDDVPVNDLNSDARPLRRARREPGLRGN